MTNIRAELLERFKDPIPVLDKGHVRLVDVMGDDTAVVQAARVSYGNGTYEHDWDGDDACKVCRKHCDHPDFDEEPNRCAEAERRLIRYLMSHRHTTPLEMCEIKLHIMMPMDAHRQQIRHRTANVNEFSTRYSEALDDMARTEPDAWRLQSKSSKQGSSGLLTEWPDSEPHKTTPGEYLSHREKLLQDFAREVYEERLKFGVAREVARKDLPLSTYTHYYWKMDLHNLLHYLGLRLDPHAQLEIRAFAEAIAEIVKVWVPMTWEAFQDYRLGAHTFSAQEMSVLRDVLARAEVAIMPGVPSKMTWKRLFDSHGVKSKRERAAFLRSLGLIE